MDPFVTTHDCTKNNFKNKTGTIYFAIYEKYGVMYSEVIGVSYCRSLLKSCVINIFCSRRLRNVELLLNDSKCAVPKYHSHGDKLTRTSIGNSFKSLNFNVKYYSSPTQHFRHLIGFETILPTSVFEFQIYQF